MGGVRGHAVGVLGPALVAQLDSAPLAGASLTQGLLAGGPATVVALALLAVTAGALWLAQHRQLARDTPPRPLEGTATVAPRVMLWAAPATALAAGLALPIGVLVYTATANLVSFAQQLAMDRWVREA